MENKEILSIEWHTCDLLVKALNRAATIKQSCQLLGISERTIYRLMSVYNIVYNSKDRRYTAHRIPKYIIRKANDT